MSLRVPAALACAAALLCVPAAASAKVDTFVPIATLKPTDEDNPEITAVSPDGLTGAATMNDHLGFYDLRDPAHPQLTGRLTFGGRALTSVGITRDAKHAIVTSYDSIFIVDMAEREVERMIPFGGSLDSVAISPDGRYAAIANENEVGDPDHPGSLLILDTTDWSLRNVAFDPSDPAIEDKDNIQPEFVDINQFGIAAVTLQENNAVALVDVAKAKVLD